MSTLAIAIASDRDIWQAAQRLGLYGRSSAELDAVIREDNGMTVDAARFVLAIRRGLAAGEAC
jgi:hypothetical protein